MIAPALLKFSFALNDEQRKIVAHKQGPLLVIAGPGSGKTCSLTLLAMNLLLCDDAHPSQMVLCTYTEKAAYELQDRLMSVARDVQYAGDLSRLRVGTIHSICQQLINEHLYLTPLGNNYETLDQFTQQLLIFEHLDEICPEKTQAFFRDRWNTPWNIAKKLKYYFDAIAEELIFDKLKAAYPRLEHHATGKETLLYYVTHAYLRYLRVLERTNSIDFAHIQKCAYNLLYHSNISQKIVQGIRYVLVDEYQDTSYIQEQILMKLASGCEPNNLVVIGDEDQALYRFRGATVRNILTFTESFPDCDQVDLKINYRSHPGIIEACNRWMALYDWSNPAGSPMRTKKMICAHPDYAERQSQHASVFSIDDIDVQGEATQFAEFVDTLKRQGYISDYSEVALLLYSVKPWMSEAYIKALKAKDIPAYCPRAKTFFEQEECMLMIGCLARLLRQPTGTRNPLIEENKFPNYLDDCQIRLAEYCRHYPVLEKELRAIEAELKIEEEKSDSEFRLHIGEYFYRFIFHEPLFSFLSYESQRANLVKFSKLLRTFEKCYQRRLITQEEVRIHFFGLFLNFLFEDGLNQDEDQQQPLLKGHVQIMTIYQAKGLEFPVVVVGRLDQPAPTSENERADLRRFFHYPSFEPVNRIPGCDRRRLYYVAFSRARDILILTAYRRPHTSFSDLWQTVPAWVYRQTSIAHMSKSAFTRQYEPLKPRYGFTSHIQTYMTCPRRYQYLYDYHFAPSRSVDAFFGQLVHQTIEQIHHRVLDGELVSFDEQQLQDIFEKAFSCLLRGNMRPITAEEKDQAFHQVLNYVQHNWQALQGIRAAEFPVQVEEILAEEKNTYLLAGTVDLLLNGSKGLEILDFKTLHRPAENSAQLISYKRQLYFYAYAIQKHFRQLPQHLFLYWTAEERKENALMEIPYHEDDMQQTMCAISKTVAKIQQQQFTVGQPPSPHVCKTCDVRHLCRKERIIL